MSAGLYTFAIEEFGKLLLLKKCIIQTGICSIPYRDGFVDHSYKAKVAFDYLQENHADECISLTRNGFSTVVSIGEVSRWDYSQISSHVRRYFTLM